VYPFIRWDMALIVSFSLSACVTQGDAVRTPVTHTSKGPGSISRPKPVCDGPNPLWYIRHFAHSNKLKPGHTSRSPKGGRVRAVGTIR
jgi:hypothetical protein